MTGPEHYAEAERLTECWRVGTCDPAALAAAQVHATLALAAASATTGYNRAGDAWAEAFLP